MSTKVSSVTENDATSRADTIDENLIDPEPANVTWFRSKVNLNRYVTMFFKIPTYIQRKSNKTRE